MRNFIRMINENLTEDQIVQVLALIGEDDTTLQNIEICVAKVVSK